MPYKDQEKKKRYAKEYSQSQEVKEKKNKYSKEYYQRNKEKIKIYKKNYRQSPEAKEKKKQYMKEYHQKPEVKKKQKQNSWKYQGIKDMTIERYNKILEEQNNCCKICGKNQLEFKKKLHIDHCHSTGEVRGIVCYRCNIGLGFIDNKIWFDKVLKYLGDKGEI